jgi:quinolinate synthase
VVNSLKNEEIIFLPDKYLGKYVSSKTDKKIIFWEGYCPTHVRILSEDIKNQKLQHPKAEVLVHPECTPEVTAAADRVLSTGGMMKYAAEGKKKEFIIGTEIGMVYTLKKKYPDKKFYPASLKAVCLNMKLTTLEKILWAIDKEIALVTVPEEIRVRARTAIDRMLEVKVSA